MNYNSMSQECRKAEGNVFFNELLINEQFSVYEIDTNGEIDTVSFRLGGEYFSVMVCMEGDFRIENNSPLTLNKGRSVFIPAGIDTLTLSGNGKMLYIHSFFYS